VVYVVDLHYFASATNRDGFEYFAQEENFLALLRSNAANDKLAPRSLLEQPFLKEIAKGLAHGRSRSTNKFGGDSLRQHRPDGQFSRENRETQALIGKLSKVGSACHFRPSLFP
jgi:hypothetical protein